MSDLLVELHLEVDRTDSLAHPPAPVSIELKSCFMHLMNNVRACVCALPTVLESPQCFTWIVLCIPHPTSATSDFR